MQTIVNKLRIMLPVIFLLFIGTISVWGDEGAEDNKRKKEIEKIFKVGQNDRLEIDNRYGNITVSYWEKSEVNIRIVIEANARSSSRAQELLDYVTIDLNQYGGIVKGVTVMKTFGGTKNNERLNIHYIISMPSRLSTQLSQKYGNINITGRSEGKYLLNVKYGNIMADDFTDDLTIDVAYGNVRVGNVNNANLVLAYCGKTSIGNGNTLKIDSKYSNTDMKDVKKLSMEDKYGNVAIGRADQVRLSLKYSNGKIERIAESLEVDALDYGGLEVYELTADFKRVDITARYGNATIRVPAAASFTVDAQNMKYGNYKINGFNTQNRSDKSGNVSHYSTVNNGSNRKISFNGNKYSNLTIKAL